MPHCLIHYIRHMDPLTMAEFHESASFAIFLQAGLSYSDLFYILLILACRLLPLVLAAGVSIHGPQVCYSKISDPPAGFLFSSRLRQLFQFHMLDCTAEHRCEPIIRIRDRPRSWIHYFRLVHDIVCRQPARHTMVCRTFLFRLTECLTLTFTHG